eukprot:1328979-Karenia_brevis.AAC.1
MENMNASIQEQIGSKAEQAEVEMLKKKVLDLEAKVAGANPCASQSGGSGGGGAQPKCYSGSER